MLMRMYLTSLVLAVLQVSSAYGLKIGAFNVQVFGQRKAANQSVLTTLAKIAVRYDIMLVQEIRDSKGDAIEKLRRQIKQDHGVDMALKISDRLGRTNNKEQYAFLYRADNSVSVVDSYRFDDGDERTGNDLFEREPFIVRFHLPRAEVQDLSLVALHTAPRTTVAELQALTKVVEDVRQRWSTPNILILGDLNADCDYVPKRDWPNISMRTDNQYMWLIEDDVDTTVAAGTDCAYDRFIAAGNQLKRAVVEGSARIFDFQKHYSLNDEQALAVSDHYPIELELRETTARQVSNGSRGGSHRDRVVATLDRLWQGVVNTFSGRRGKRADL